MSDDAIREARRWFAEELRFVARVGDPRIVEAFASVPRERFVGPGPLRILSSWNMKDYWTPPGPSPAAVYHDVLIAYDEKRRLNNGQPSLWAFVFDKLNVTRGERVLHLGCGIGYYTAVLAELVGPAGAVTAIEIENPSRNAHAKRSRRGLRSRSSRRRGEGFVRPKRCRGRERRRDSPLARVAALPQAEWTAGFSHDGDERGRRHASRPAPRARRVRGAFLMSGLVL